MMNVKRSQDKYYCYMCVAVKQILFGCQIEEFTYFSVLSCNFLPSMLDWRWHLQTCFELPYHTNSKQCWDEWQVCHPKGAIKWKYKLWLQCCQRLLWGLDGCWNIGPIKGCEVLHRACCRGCQVFSHLRCSGCRGEREQTSSHKAPNAT